MRSSPGSLPRAQEAPHRSEGTAHRPRIGKLEPDLAALSDDALHKASLAIRYRAKSGEPLESLLPESFALVREAGQRTLGMRHYDVQLLGGMAMHHHAIAEMQTGEGKTLTATLPMYLAALTGAGAHLATANDYLAKRDAELMTPLYRLLGVSVGILQSSSTPAERRAAYGCDVCYGTAKEFGFDFLRDRLIKRRRADELDDLLGRMLGHASDKPSDGEVGRDLNFLLVDEADSLLIDEARTPLVISGRLFAPRSKPSQRWLALSTWRSWRHEPDGLGRDGPAQRRAGRRSYSA